MRHDRCRNFPFKAIYILYLVLRSRLVNVTAEGGRGASHTLWFLCCRRFQGRDYGFVEHILELELCQSRALHVLDSSQFLGHLFSVLLSYRLHLLSGQFLPRLCVISQIRLCADDETRHSRAMVMHFGEPFLSHVFEGCRGGHGKANQEDICLRIRKRSQTVVIFLPSSIEET